MAVGTQQTAGIGERAATGEEILRVEGLFKHFPIRAGLLKRQVGQVHAVEGVDPAAPGLVAPAHAAERDAGLL